MRTFAVAIISLLLSFAATSQNEANIWYFGSYAGLDFNNGHPAALTDNLVMDCEKSSVVMSDNKGNLLFFSDGERVWNRNFQVMKNGEGLWGSADATQSCIIIPSPGSSTLYYIFTLDRIPPQGTKGLNYSVVDMEGDGGLGEVSSKNNFLMTQVSEQVTAALHENRKDVWVIVHGWQSSLFHAFLVSESGVAVSPVSSDAGSIHGSSSEEAVTGYMKASPDGKKIVTALYNRDMFEFFSFDNSDGHVTFLASSKSDFPGAYSVEFSPDSRLVYGSTYYLNRSATSYIFQFNITSGDIAGSAASIPTTADIMIMGCALQLAPNGKIYVSVNNADSIGVIKNPDREGIQCKYVEDVVSLAGRRSRTGLPNFLPAFNRIPPFYYENNCPGDSVFFTISNPDNIDSVFWDFDDPSSGAPNYSHMLNPYHIYTLPGEYNVKLQVYYMGNVYKNSSVVIVREPPAVDLGQDVLIYPGTYTVLDAGAGYASYQWQDGLQEQYYTASSEGEYIVQVSDVYGCINSDTVQVFYLPIIIPNAFTPNGDAVNDLFMPLLPEAGITNFRLFIYDRWGGLIFETTDFMAGWDGTSNGEPCISGVYTWYVRFDARLESHQNRKVERRGTVLLMR